MSPELRTIEECRRMVDGEALIVLHWPTRTTWFIELRNLNEEGEYIGRKQLPERVSKDVPGARKWVLRAGI